MIKIDKTRVIVFAMQCEHSFFISKFMLILIEWWYNNLALAEHRAVTVKPNNKASQIWPEMVGHQPEKVWQSRIMIGFTTL